METLRSLVGDPELFLAAAWRREARVLRPSAPPAQLVTLADLDTALTGGLLRRPYLELVRGGQNLELGDFTSARRVGAHDFPGYADPDKVLKRVSSGATLLMRNIDHWHPGAAALSGRLSAELGFPVEAFLFVTPPGEQGLGTHRDDADVFVVQLNGSKRWQVHGVPATGEWDAGYTSHPGPVVLETTVEPGQVLYIPRGAPHSAVGRSGGLSVHLSLTVRPPGTEALRAVRTTAVPSLAALAEVLDG
ncbi:cupin domain-containing protein [Streptomyces sp. NBC_00249]|uniref:JmjC domain-containing protein n=1 Tax=Streptomyces sp. NBC_00249 TaxID=2975690 RepID=UPI00224DBD7B|nr:cupin domain-containing protein [Streptomyces sp. NBC_00249]MCX5195368.1 cupin domain-containing protein [Streptomyces sp. NBC_00249]